MNLQRLVDNFAGCCGLYLALGWVNMGTIPDIWMGAFQQAFVEYFSEGSSGFGAKKLQESIVYPVWPHGLVIFELGDRKAHFFGGYWLVQEV